MSTDLSLVLLAARACKGQVRTSLGQWWSLNSVLLLSEAINQGKIQVSIRYKYCYFPFIMIKIIQLLQKCEENVQKIVFISIQAGWGNGQGSEWKLPFI